MCLNKLTAKISGLYNTRQYQLSATELDDKSQSGFWLLDIHNIFEEDEVLAFCGSFKLNKKI